MAGQYPGYNPYGGQPTPQQGTIYLILTSLVFFITTFTSYEAIATFYCKLCVVYDVGIGMIRSNHSQFKLTVNRNQNFTKLQANGNTI